MKTLSLAASRGPQAVSKHRVVLIPGFLGFNKFGDHGYFAKTVGHALIEKLTGADPGASVDVDVAETIPAGTLAERQAKLVSELKQNRQAHPEALFHLVGHSSGGLDAELLIRGPLPGQRRDAAADEIRRAIRSVITLASPLAGTSLALTPLAKLSAIDPLHDLPGALRAVSFAGLSAIAHVLENVAGLLHSDTAAEDIAHNIFHKAFASYLVSVLLKRGLIRDLEPARLCDILEHTPEDHELSAVHRARFLTIAPPPPRAAHVRTASQRLFAYFYENTRRAAQAGAAETREVQRALEARTPAIPLIGKQSLPELGPGANDAIVDTLRQVLPCTSAAAAAREVGLVKGIVIADHIDVVGYYPGKDGRDNGFLSSGALFRGDEFAALYASIASEICASINAPPRAATAKETRA